MLLVIDESKKLWQGKIVIWGYISSHNKSYIDNFIQYKKEQFCIQENRELKSSNMFGKEFLKNIEVDSDFSKLQIQTFWYVFDNYYKDDEEQYRKFLENILQNILWNILINKVHIVHDRLSLKNQKQFIQKLKSYLQAKWCKAQIEILDSKKRLYLQLADLVVSQYKELFLFDDVVSLPNYIQRKDIFYNKKT